MRDNLKRKCQICGRDETQVEILPAIIVRPAVAELIKISYPDWDLNGFVCSEDLLKYRKEYLQKLITDEKGELSTLEIDVINKLTEHESISVNVEEEFSAKLTFGEKLSDSIASFGGSWKFIIIFFMILFSWILLNTYALVTRPFDPYPYIF